MNSNDRGFLSVKLSSVFLLAAACGLFAGEPVLPELTLERCAAAPVIDGDLGDPCWQKAVTVGPLANLHASEGAPKEKTYVYLTRDEDNLYIGFRCFESHPERIVAEHTKRDSNIWEDDCVEIFLDTTRNRSAYYHFVVNALGAQYDEDEKNNSKWNGDWIRGVKKAKDFWSVELAIPFRILRIAGDAWGINFTRERHGVPAESTTWSPVRETFGFHDPERFGLVKGIGAAVYSGPVVEEVSLGNLIGTNRVEIAVKNTGKPRKLKVKANLTDPQGKGWATESGAFDLPAGAEETLFATYALDQSGLHKVALELVDAEAKKTIHSILSDLRVPALLDFALSTTSYYNDDKVIPLEISVNAAEDARKQIEVSIAVKDARGKTVSAKNMSPRDAKIYVNYDISNLPLGKYILAVAVRRGGQITAQSRKAFEVIEGFW